MMVIVNDANILIDLLKMDLLETFFRLPFEFHVTDLAAGEILEENVDQLHGCVPAHCNGLLSWPYIDGRRASKVHSHAERRNEGNRANQKSVNYFTAFLKDAKPSKSKRFWFMINHLDTMNLFS